MDLTLNNGYPYPYPDHLSEAEQEKLNDQATCHRLTLTGVKSFEIKHTITIEFESAQDYHVARIITGWADWYSERFILEATTSTDNGYAMLPAIVVKGMAYCGIFLEG